MAGTAYIGTSGWQYDHWIGVLYPPELNKRAWLEEYCRHFDTVEINSTFYHQPRPVVFAGWRKRTPDGFVIVPKANRFITHRKKLADAGEPLERFLAGARKLEQKLGPVLFQLPRSFRVDADRLDGFLKLLRRKARKLRVAFEFREPGWLCDEIFEILGKRHAALCFADWPLGALEEPLTTDFVYVRRHGAGQVYAGAYSDGQLAADADRIRAWLADGRDVFGFFNNDALGHAVVNALTLRRMLGLPPVPGE